MKINELLHEGEQLDELEPGDVPSRLNIKRYFGQGKKNVQTLKQDKQLAKNLYQAWNAYAVRINRALANDAELIPKSVQYFKSFISKALKIPQTNDMFKEIDNMLGANGMNYNKATAQKVLDYAVSQRAMASLPLPAAGGSGGNNIPINTRVSLGIGGNYIWTGQQWVNSSNNQPAPANLVTRLNQTAQQQLGSQTP
jgi:hypothetical protein